MDELNRRASPTPDDGREAQLDAWLAAWFQALLDEPTPTHLIELLGHLDDQRGM